MPDEEIVKYLDEVYAVGFKNGQIEMKNKVLKKINRDWSIMSMRGKDPVDVAMYLLKKISKIPLSSGKRMTKLK